MLSKRSKQHNLLHFLIGKFNRKDQTGFPHPFALIYNETYNESYISKLHHYKKMKGSSPNNKSMGYYNYMIAKEKKNIYLKFSIVFLLIILL